MNIVVNGRDMEFNTVTVEELLAHLDIDKEHVVVERNGEIVHREAYGQLQLQDKDTLEVVRFVGGG